MFIKSVDILSEGPKISIFNQMYNKTLFGGALSLIFIIIFLLISIAYLADYFVNDKYSVEYGIYHTELSHKEEYDPTLDFSIDLLYDENTNLSDRFYIYDDYKGRFVGRNEKFSSKLSELSIGIVYKCENESCLINEDDKTLFNYIALLKYQGYIFDHQGDIPLYKSDGINYITSHFFFSKASNRTFEMGNNKILRKKIFFIYIFLYIWK